MNISHDGDEIYCHGCMKWIDTLLDTYQVDFNIHCLECNAHLGYEWDLPIATGIKYEMQ